MPVHVGSFPNCSTSPVVNGHSVTCTECSYQNCVEGDYGDWYSCPGETFTSRDQNAFEYGDPTMGGLGWTALELQGYTLKNPSLHEGYKARPASGRAVSAARSQLAVSHFSESRENAQMPGVGSVKQRGPFEIPARGDSARCDRQFTRRVRSLSQSVGEFPGYGDLGYHVDNNNHWVQTVQDFVGAAHESANSACARKLLRLVSRHLGCEGKAQSAELRGRNNWGSRIRLRCDQRLEKGLNSLVEKYPEPVSCAAHFEASEVIEASRSDFRGETVRVGD